MVTSSWRVAGAGHNYGSSDNRAVLRPHTARYTFVDARGRDAGQENTEVARRTDGWLVTSRLELSLPESLTCDIEWHLEVDLATHILYMASTDHWGDDYTLEAAVTGNGLLASRTGPDGPTQVEMGWGPAVELDHLSASFTTVLLARWDKTAQPRREITTVYIGADDLVPEPLDQRYRVVARDQAGPTTRVERVTPSTGGTALITVLDSGMVQGYERLFRLTDWSFTD